MHVHCIYRYIALKLDQIAKMIINYIILHFKYNVQCIEIELNCTDDQAQCSVYNVHSIEIELKYNDEQAQYSSNIFSLHVNCSLYIALILN